MNGPANRSLVLLFVPAACLSLIGLSVMGQPRATRAADTPAASARERFYDLHEWGVFTVHSDIQIANAAMRAEWNDLPGYVYGRIPGRSLPPETALINKPVIYLHADRREEVALAVEFPEKGLPAVWWPKTSMPTDAESSENAEQAARTRRFLQWHLTVDVPQPAKPGRSEGPNEKPAAPPVRSNSSVPRNERHWFDQLRRVTASVVSVPIDGRADHNQNEKFVYYDGLVPTGHWAEITATRDGVRVRNTGKGPLLDITAVEVAAEGAVRVARHASLAGDATEALDFQPVAKADWPRAGADVLTKQLTRAGLHLDEAAALVEIWSKDFFSTEGLTVFYRLQQEEYDRLLKLKAQPAARKQVRVGLVLHPFLSPDLTARIDALVKQLDRQEFEEREAAFQRLEALGPAAFAALARQHKGKNLDLSRRIEQLIEKYDSRVFARP